MLNDRRTPPSIRRSRLRWLVGLRSNEVKRPPVAAPRPRVPMPLPFRLPRPRASVHQTLTFPRLPRRQLAEHRPPSRPERPVEAAVQPPLDQPQASHLSVPAVPVPLRKAAELRDSAPLSAIPPARALARQEASRLERSELRPAMSRLLRQRAHELRKAASSPTARQRPASSERKTACRIEPAVQAERVPPSPRPAAVQLASVREARRASPGEPPARPLN